MLTQEAINLANIKAAYTGWPETLLASFQVPVYKTIRVIFNHHHAQYGPVLLATGITVITLGFGYVEAWDCNGHFYQWFTNHVREFHVR